MTPRDFPYADARRILRESLSALLPPIGISVAEHAAAKRWVKAPGGHLRLWSHETAPYLTEPMEELSSGNFDTMAIVGPAASGKTMIAENWLLHTIDTDPADTLWYMQDDAAVRAYVKSRIETMLDEHEKLIDGRLLRSSIEMKRFEAMTAEFLPFTPGNIVNKHVRRIVADEWDAYDKAMGDPLAALNPRRQAAAMNGGSMLLAISHPDRAVPLNRPDEEQRGIMALYLRSDRRRWWWPCPHCGGFSSPNPGAPHRMIVAYDDRAPLEEIEAEAHLLCPHCQGQIRDASRHDMLQAGRWVGRGEEIDLDGRVSGQRVTSRTAGFWIMGVMSPFTMGGIGGLARARVEAERQARVTGEDKGLRNVVAKMWCEVYEPPRALQPISVEAMLERLDARLSRGTVPEWVRVITVGVDVQGNRFEWLARGWGRQMESVVVDHGAILDVEPAFDPECWDAMYRTLTAREFPLADGSGRVMRARVIVHDTQGVPGTAEQAAAAWRRARLARLARMPGMINGRPAWTLVGSKGAASRNAPRLTLALPETQRKDRRSMRGADPLLLFNPNLVKDALLAQLQRAEVGPGYVHLPAWLAEGGSTDWLEQLVAEKRGKDGAWAKESESARNEAMDLMVLAEIGARLHGLHRIDWNRPPAWADVWGRNSMIYVPDETGPSAPLADGAGAPPQPEPPAAAAVAAPPSRPPPPRQSPPRAMRPPASREERRARIIALMG